MEDGRDPNRNTRIYAIGDIHGRLDLLDRMIAKIERDAGERGGPSLVITLGDYVDRGPESRGVIERLSGNPFPGDFVALKGNHEEFLQTFLDDPRIGPHWQGGIETLASFGICVSPLLGEGAFAAASRQLREALTGRHREFLDSLRLSFSTERYFFCHAGVRPGVPLDRQDNQDLLWIREGFLDSDADFGKIIVHGHTPVMAPELRPNRINVDTGAFATDRLTCVVLENGSQRFITA